jgi:hypothetical protein
VTGDGTGHLFAAGYGFSGGCHQHAYVRRSSDGGATWAVVDDFQQTDNFGLVQDITGFAVDAAHRIYYTGIFQSASNSSHWLLRQSTDGGASFHALSEFNPLAAGGNGSGIIASGGNLISVGEFADGVSPISTAVLIQSTAWTTADDYGPAGSPAAMGISVDPASGALYSFGTQTVGFTSHWHVRKSLDHGVSWSDSDDYQFDPAAFIGSTPLAAGVDGSHRIFVTGQGYDGSFQAHMITRMSSDNGATWTVADSFTTAPFGARGGSIAIDPMTDQVYAGGGANTYLLRTSIDHGVTWTTRTVPTGSNVYNEIQVVASANGQLFGLARDPNRDRILKSNDHGISWTVIDDALYGNAVEIGLCSANQVCAVMNAPGWTTRVLSP